MKFQGRDFVKIRVYMVFRGWQLSKLLRKEKTGDELLWKKREI
jgi:hypothetical protein